MDLAVDTAVNLKRFNLRDPQSVLFKTEVCSLLSNWLRPEPLTN